MFWVHKGNVLGRRFFNAPKACFNRQLPVIKYFINWPGSMNLLFPKFNSTLRFFRTITVQILEALLYLFQVWHVIEITAITMEAVPLNFTDQFAFAVSINI